MDDTSNSGYLSAPMVMFQLHLSFSVVLSSLFALMWSGDANRLAYLKPTCSVSLFDEF
jgi:hypothetical protein